jgi:hypothetical protein
MQESDAQESARREFGRKLTHRTGRREPDCRDVVLASEVSNKTIPRLDKACFELVFRRKPLCAVRTGVIAVYVTSIPARQLYPNPLFTNVWDVYVNALGEIDERSSARVRGMAPSRV